MKVAREYFGSCHECGKIDGWANAGGSHVCYCAEHKTMWSVGYNLFSGWKNETEEEQRKKWNKIGLEDFVYVSPVLEGTPIFEPSSTSSANVDAVLIYAGGIVSAGITQINKAADKELLEIERSLTEGHGGSLYKQAGVISVAKVLHNAAVEEIGRRERNRMIKAFAERVSETAEGAPSCDEEGRGPLWPDCTRAALARLIRIFPKT